MIRTVLLVAVAAAAAACAGAPASSSPSSAGPGGDGGAALYRARCTGCHRAYERGTRTRAEWHAVLARMAPKAHLSPSEQDVLRGWLDAGASDAAGGGR